MGRRRRNRAEPCCYHVTHRCQERRFLLRFKQDRRNYLERLRETSLRFNIAVLDYMVTSNHIHLLIYTQSAAELSSAMHYLQGNAARDYNWRKGREGAFWRGRYHPTMIQNGEHLGRCLFYIDLNMVRAKVCEDPSEWDGGSYNELTGNRRRYRIIDRERLLNCLTHPGDFEGFCSWYKLTLKDHLGQYYHCREPVWTESLAVGSKAWLEGLSVGIKGVEIKPVSQKSPQAREDTAIYGLSGSGRTKEAFWKKQQEKF